MRKWIGSCIAISFFSGLLISCTREKETVLIQERTAPAKIESSLTISKNSFEIAKSSLSKAFLLLPRVKTSSRAPILSFMKPLVVSFEKHADKIGVFNLTSQNIYDNLKAQSLLQTFNILSETEDKIVVDLDKGFLSLDLKECIDIINPETFSDDLEKGSQKAETSVLIKDSLITSMQIRNNAVLIEQSVRIVQDFKNPYKEFGSNSGSNTKGNEKEKVEISQVLNLEIRPYRPRTEYKVKLSDSRNRFGYFINKAFLAKKDELEPQIVKWYVGADAGPIKVHIDQGAPASLTPAIIEGVTYWNRVMGTELLQVEKDYVESNPQEDRSIIIRWIPWDKASGAYANVQSDPLTGEALRGHIYMSSAFAKNKTASSESAFRLEGFSRGTGLCNLSLDKANMGDMNVIRHVIAHEMGHVMGLRHNFSGTYNSQFSDEKIEKALDRLEPEDPVTAVADSSTVMDYSGLTYKNLNGAYIVLNELKYDKDAINWGYHNIESDAKVDSYCSDEHLGAGKKLSKKLIGCTVFDVFRNPFRELVYARKEQFKNAVQNKVLELVKQKESGLKLNSSISFTYASDFFNSLSPYLYTSNEGNPFLKIQRVVDNILDPMLKYGVDMSKFWSMDDGTGDQELSRHLLDMGGLSGLFSYAETLSSTFNADLEKILKTSELFQNKFTQEEQNFILGELSKKVVAGESEFNKSLLYNLEPGKIRLGIKTGDLLPIIQKISQNLLYREGSMTFKVNGQEVNVSFLKAAVIPDALVLKSTVLLRKTNWPISVVWSSEITEAINSLKFEAKRNLFAIAKAAGLSVSEKDSAQSIIDEIKNKNVVFEQGNFGQFSRELELVLKIDAL